MCFLTGRSCDVVKQCQNINNINVGILNDEIWVRSTSAIVQNLGYILLDTPLLGKHNLSLHMGYLY